MGTSENPPLNPGKKWIEKEYDGEDLEKWVFTREDMENAFNCGVIEANSKRSERERK